MEAIDLTNLEPVHISLGGSENQRNSNNLGEGMELLMNGRKSNDTSKTRIDLGELDKLEEELNDLSYDNNTDTKKVDTNNSFGGFAKSMFGTNDNHNVEPVIQNDSNLGSSTAETMGTQSKTWDGFSKLNSTSDTNTTKSNSLSDREKRRKKRMMLKHLEDWHEKGIIKNMHKLTLDSNFDEIEDEYEGALDDKRKRDSVKMQQNWLITMVNTIEYGNSMFDPFGVSLDGWGESIGEDVDSYNEIFEELHAKYKGGKMSPELSLLLRLGFTASVCHFSNKALSTAAPGFNDVIKQSPELMRMFTDATMNSMKETAPGMSFASELLQQNKPGTNQPPPVSVKTRDQPPQSRPSMNFTSNNNPVGSTMFRETGVDVGTRTSVNSQSRPEMSGPTNSNINDILSGLKTKSVDIRSDPKDNDSVVSISSINDMSAAVIPKKSYKRKSDKNVVSIDI
jgi:hypothetical protein